MTVLIIILIFLAVVFIAIYNRIVTCQSLMQEAVSGMDVQLKRRHDLVPNMVEIVKAYSQHEKTVLEDVTRARSQAQGAGTLSDKQQAEKALSQGLKSIIAVGESYPELKADQNFLSLQNTLSQIEDQIQMSRRYYNGTVRNLNILLQSFPGNIVASVFKFQPASYFEIEYATQRQTPDISF